MKSTIPDPIVAEVRHIRAQHAAKFGFDLQAIYSDIRANQEKSGRTYVRYPARPAIITSNPVKNGN